ncbi:MAG: serine hydrolase domain-containing protein [Candidatus Binatus sp.]|uniref:serine hydrolase domain-containing protein n=1 Tax=Candidatus Binatus sp. TaxID=2811406 RepID=UPI00271939E1|nr:serine hydrolase domain-containing protein [Candidatus Binatus sp.]MDO8432816.1 serine hydrolase domain-containing protein [Candidatus Binatus sp.]
MNINPKAAGLSPLRLETLDRFIQARYIDEGKIAGALTVIARRGEVGHFSPLGLADVERKTPVREDTIFRLYSMTKPLTSVAFMTLVEQGMVALDDPVHRVIPEWRNLGVYRGGFMETFRTVRPERPMLMIDLLRHTSGLTYGFQQTTNVDAAYRKLQVGERTRDSTLDDMVRQLSTLPLEFSPGTAWNYSVSTDVLGYLVGKISGQPFDQYLHSRILQPLGMNDTAFYVPASKQSRLGSCYSATPKGGMALFDDCAKSTYLQEPSLLSGGGGLASTAGDYLRFCRMLLNGGTLDGVQILSPKTIQLMTLNHLPGGKDLPALSRSLFSEVTYNGVGFGMGFAITLDNTFTMLPGSVGDYSWGGAASTYFWIDPKEDLITIFMAQLLPSTTYPIRRELRTLVYSAFAESNS